MTEFTFSPQVKGTLDAGVLLVEIDNPPVNALSAEVRQGLLAAIEQAAGDPEVKAVAIIGAGRIFIGGADIREFGQAPVEPHLPDVLMSLERSAKPIVAAINGAALGGGLEVALAAHRRLCAPTATLAFPEVKLGLIPGAGGTQRLPRLIGIPAAIDLIANGRTVSAAEATRMGLVDRLESGPLRAAAQSEARSLVGTKAKRTGERAVATPDATADEAAKRVLARMRGQDAPKEAIRLVKLTAESSLADGLAEERATFLRLKQSEQSAALRHVFFAERASAKVEGLEEVVPRAVNTLGVIGTGLMGAGIAVTALDAGLKVVAVDQGAEAAAKGRERIDSLLERAVKAGKYDDSGRAQRLSRLIVSADPKALAAADLVIEAVFDDLDVKSKLFSILDSLLPPQTILATNTSYLDPDRLAAATGRPDHVLGLHFFSPAHVMRLVEVVRCAETAPKVLASGIALARKLGKLPIVCGVTEGFIGNRMFSAYRREAEFLLEDGALPAQIDRAMEAYGLAMGPFAVFDMAGLDIAWAKRKREAATRDPKARYVTIPDRLCEAGRLGQKTGRGWYRYDAGKREEDAEVTAIIEAARREKGIAAKQIGDEEIVRRLLGAMQEEGRKLLEEKIAERSSDIDLVMIHGYGFPSYRGGPMFATK